MRYESPWLNFCKFALFNRRTPLVLGLAVCFSAQVQASSNVPIYTFRDGTDGGTPEAGLIMAPDGTIYGTADRGGGGTRNSGTIYSLTPPVSEAGSWAFKVLYRFTGGSDGGYPLGLTMDKAGNLFGYAFTSYGLVFELEKPAMAGRAWRYHKLYAFQGGADGSYPDGIATQQDGSLIGTTSHGGTGDCRFPGDDFSSGCGVIFQLKPPAKEDGTWTETTIHRFGGPGTGDGALPNGAPILWDKALWGVTVEGGAESCSDLGSSDNIGCGSVYKLTKGSDGSWVESTEYSFKGGGNGWVPVAGLAADRNGVFYGVTAAGGTGPSYYGGGIVYRLVPTSGGFQLNVLHMFSGDGDGSSPQGGVIVTPNGARIFGTTSLGPVGSFGTLFLLGEVPPGSGAWKEYILGRFSGPEGAYPGGQIVRDKLGAVYGVAIQGGKYNQGTVFKVVN
jgi:hypothetical protein